MTLKSKTYIGSLDDIGAFGIPPETRFMIVGARSSARGDVILRRLSDMCPQAQIHLATSCQGMMTERELSLASNELAVMTLEDPRGAFGTASAYPDAPIDETERHRENIHRLLHTAELRASRAGELPSLVWLSASPGFEEVVIDAIRAYYQSPVLICGGSPADDDITGQWWTGDQVKINPQGITISLIYTTAQVSTRFSSGYQVADASGLITQSGRRRIISIDHQPAAHVYNAWCRGSIAPYFPDGNILQASAFQPLAISCGKLGLSPYYRVLHPERIYPDGSVSTFSQVEQGQRVVLLSGDPNSLIGRARRVARGAISDNGGDLSRVRGALVIYCAGAFLAIKEHIDQVWEGLKFELPNIPILCQFTFGEQGVFPDGEVAHGNLMITVVLFSDPPESTSWLD